MGKKKLSPFREIFSFTQISKISHTIKYIISHIKIIIKRNNEFFGSVQKKCIINRNTQSDLCIYTKLLELRTKS